MRNTGMAQTLGDVPFTMIAASEDFSLSISKTEASDGASAYSSRKLQKSSRYKLTGV